MDLRTIINFDAATAPKTTSAQQSPNSNTYPPTHDRHASHTHDAPSPGAPYNPPPALSEQRTRPPQPPPLQPPLHSPSGSSSYGSAQSPYQHTSASSMSGGGPHSQSGQSFPHGIQPNYHHSASRDPYGSNSATPGQQQSAGLLSSPYTPQAAQPFYPPQRAQPGPSAPPPPPAQGYPYPPRESPMSVQQHSMPPQQQSFSPSQPRSHPGTPLGPPSASYSRPSPHPTRPPSSGRESQHNSLSSPWRGPEMHGRNEQRDATSPITHPPQLPPHSTPEDHYQRRYSADKDQESVSPRTIVSNSGRPSDASDLHGQTVQAGRKDTDGVAYKGNDINRGAANFPGNTQEPGGTTYSQYPPTTPTPSHQQPPSSGPSTISPPSKRLRSEISSSSTMPSRISPMAENNTQSSLTASQAPGSLKRKRKRYREPPIYARKAPRTSGKPPAIPSDYQAGATAPSKPAAVKPESTSRPASVPPRPPALSQANGQGPVNGVTETSLGPWEPSIMGVIPHEEVTKLICDFLFQQVVMRKDIAAGPAGGSATGQGAILEVEAKLGQLVDRNRGTRLHLPVLTECIISKDDPNMRIAFESSMSQAQHRSLNDFLNNAVKASMPQPGTTRIPLSYAHKKERDTFYEISPSALPPIIQHHLNPRHKPKVRVTTDQRTGAVLAKIVKCRIADLDVYSPRTCLDWRISVNLEMGYEGDVSGLSVVDMGSGKKGGDRVKDRMSYRHLAYQIDLTQVATAEANITPQPDFDHELEIEISSAEVRRQGDLALAGDPKNQYEELIKGFVDNVRVLARATPER